MFYFHWTVDPIYGPNLKLPAILQMSLLHENDGNVKYLSNISGRQKGDVSQMISFEHYQD